MLILWDKYRHDKDYVDSILDLKTENGFGNRSDAVNAQLMYTNGAMLDAVMAATPDSPTAALVAGFHHAGFKNWNTFGYYCTFNGLALAAMKLALAGKKSAIIDCDMHEGNGTSDILLHRYA